MARSKHSILVKYRELTMEVALKHHLNMKEYIGDARYVSYKGYKLSSNWFFHSIESDVPISSIPDHVLEGYYSFIIMDVECNAWLRMWSNSADDPEDFRAGLPGHDGDIQCDITKKIHNELRESPAYKEMEVRYLTNKLLKGG